MSKSVRRLLEQFAPENYELEIALDPENKSFSGSVIIKGKKTGRPSQRITLHQKGLKIGPATIIKHDKSGDKQMKITRTNCHESYNEVRLHTEEIVYPGIYSIEVTFSGKITDQMHGLYPCYFELDGKKKFLLATQFESHHAREVFPCIDEPSAKATFDLTLITPESDIVLSNTEVKSTNAVNKTQKSTAFNTTPIMSSYLLAFVTGDMHCVEAKTKRGILMRSWAHKAQPAKTLNYANEQAVRIIEFFEDYFDTPFPLSKCDQVALPDFEVGAMENWGLITFREAAMLTDPDNRSVSSEQLVSMVVAHEISHQWFGDLVTMEWWDDLWLNESFASLMEHIALDALYPEWHQWEQYVSSDVLVSSNRDVYKDVQAVRVKVNHPDEVHSLFDPAIVYAKGGRLLKMLMDYIGEDAYRKGLKQYFDKHQYSNTTRDDLWAALSEASGKDVNGFMNPWLEQSGMPLITVTGTSNKTTNLKQERFLLDGESPDQIWPVPLFASAPIEPEIFDTKQIFIKNTKEIPLLNIHGSGHYVVHYSGIGQQSIADAIQTRAIHSEARINALNDMILLNKRGDLEINKLIDTIRGCSEEPREAVWSLMTRGLNAGTILGEYDKKIEQGVKNIKKELTHKKYSDLGWVDGKNDDTNTKLLRSTMIGYMVGSEDKSTIEEAIDKYDKSPSIEDLPSELRGIILGVVVRYRGDQKDIDRLVALYKTSNDPNIQHSIAAALTHTRDPELAKRLLSDGLGADGFVKPQDAFRWYAYFMRNKHTRDVAWNWLKENWQWIEDMFGNANTYDSWVVYSAGPISTVEWQKKFNEFFEPKKDIVALERNIKIAQSEIQARVDWHDRNIDPLNKYFS